jgi:hypothetical protein
MLVAWVVAWTRFPPLAAIQHHTYVLVWTGYIVTIMALTQRRAGTCLLTRQPTALAGLAACSALFWWGFEFLNRGVQNWFYQNIAHFAPCEYALMATLAFMTVLPALLGTYEWLATYPRLTAGLAAWLRVRCASPRLAGAGFALAGAVGLFFLPVFPNALFPLLWLALPELLRIAFWLVVAAGLWGFWRIRRGRVVRQAVPPPLPAPVRPPEAQPALVWRCLGLFNVLFALETVTDLIYLWGGCALPEGMTYAAYAHRGAYPLVVTALLSAGLTLYFFPPGRRAERDPVARVLVLGWLAQNVLLTASAAWRLHLYVDVYTLTSLRVAAFVWMGLVGFGLLAIGWRIARVRDNRWLLDVNALALLMVLLGCAWWPMDGYVARHNVKFCQEAGGPGRALDIGYLQQLGPEAIPALRTYARLPDARRAEALRAAEQLAAELQRALVNPRAWTVRRGRLARVGGVSE